MKIKTNIKAGALSQNHNEKLVTHRPLVRTSRDGIRVKNTYLASSVIGGLLLAACGAEPSALDPQPAPGPDPIVTPAPTPPPMTDGYQDGIQISGSIGFALSQDKKTRLEFSAPINPRVFVLYGGDGANYPTTPSGEAALAHSAALTYPYLLAACVADYPGIKIPASDKEVLSPMQLNLNYNLVAECAYTKYISKPYWIPQLIDDVDICGTELGADWRLPTEADLATLKDSDYDFINRTLTLVNTGMLPGQYNSGAIYFALNTYLRGADGTLKLGDLTSGVTNRVTDLAVPANQYKDALQRLGLALRCVRRTKLL